MPAPDPILLIARTHGEVLSCTVDGDQDCALIGHPAARAREIRTIAESLISCASFIIDEEVVVEALTLNDIGIRLSTASKRVRALVSYGDPSDVRSRAIRILLAGWGQALLAGATASVVARMLAGYNDDIPFISLPEFNNWTLTQGRVAAHQVGAGHHVLNALADVECLRFTDPSEAETKVMRRTPTTGFVLTACFEEG